MCLPPLHVSWVSLCLPPLHVSCVLMSLLWCSWSAGFTNAAALVMAMSQLPNLLGFPMPGQCRLFHKLSG